MSRRDWISIGRPRSFDLVTITGTRSAVSRTAVYEALETLAAWHLVEPVDGRWKLVPGTSLHLLAEQFGCLEQVRTQTPVLLICPPHRELQLLILF